MFLSNYNYFQFVFRTSTAQNMAENSALIYIPTGQFIINILASLVITISVIATIFSGWTYIKDGKEIFKN